ncbi:ABC transporter permease [Anaeromicropila populeti]|uniref:Nucleoside ABC transporter membrane protein n=1 Tax=Anaeromicropila populeti TaxID=37658 RepID=A0A1I6I8V8_9FIRM|nr:ABC transporter permease [Anaeromicropila populeti]SFR63162.1 nucleoside ABC transporter membrane protein [Anaeromicropila populeti]
MIIKFLFAAIKAGVPLLFGTTGEILSEKVGNLNLGVEGMMFMGAFCGFAVGYYTDNVFLAILASAGAGMLGALLYAVLTVTLRANQNVTGLTLTIFGSGFASFFGELLIKNSVDGTPKLSSDFVAGLAEKSIPVLGKIPVVGKLFFSHNPIVYLAVFIAVICGVYIKYTKSGLNMRAVGENPATADAAGINVSLVKYIHIIISGGICGIGGAYLSIINGGGVWNNSCVNGQGWIAVALVIFAGWSPFKAILGSFVFGGFTVLQFYIPKSTVNLPNAFYVMLPFLVTIFVLVVNSMQKSKKHAQPASCGENYYREER